MKRIAVVSIIILLSSFATIGAQQQPPSTTTAPTQTTDTSGQTVTTTATSSTTTTSTTTTASSTGGTPPVEPQASSPPSSETPPATAPQPSAAPEVPVQPVEPPQVAPRTPAPASTAPPIAAEKRDLFPNLNIYLPEGEADLRVRKLIRNVLFESQINYKFVQGDISTFLRYKYYAHDFTYKLGVFDTIEFPSAERGSRDFNRVRGGLVLLELPRSYDHRYFLLFQEDGLTFGDVTKPDNNKSNFYTKVGYQFGTPFDERLNSIVGESRGRITPVLTAYREIGPQKLGFALAATQGVDQIGGNYRYTKVESEALKRFDFFRTHFVISRLHLGLFPSKARVADADQQPPEAQYTIPFYELFKIGGRDALKGVDDSIRGTEEVHLSNEYFFPIFRDRNYRMSILRWNDLYGIGYLGGGAIGFGMRNLRDNHVVDAGAGFEANVTVRKYDIYLSGIYARAVAGTDALRGQEFRFAVRTSR